MYAKVLNDVIVKFPYSIGDLRIEHSDTSFPSSFTAETLEAFGIYKIVETTAPTVDTKTHSHLQSIQKVDGVWTRVWESRPLDQDTASANVRGHRDNLLKDCDWTQVADATVDKAAWAAYRQALRDISAQEGFPFDVVWPAKPA